MTTVYQVVSDIAAAATERGWRVMTAESCTGGMTAAALTDIAGASDWFAGGVVCYSNALKQQLLNVPAEILQKHGAVSEETATAMCTGLAAMGADIGISITGIAGPGGGSAAKPVGTVCFGAFCPGYEGSLTHWFEGDRAAVRTAATEFALLKLADMLRTAPQ